MENQYDTNGCGYIIYELIKSSKIHFLKIMNKDNSITKKNLNNILQKIGRLKVDIVNVSVGTYMYVEDIVKN